VVDFVEICNVYVGKMIIKAVQRIFNSDKIFRSYSDLNFGVTFLEHSVEFSSSSSSSSSSWCILLRVAIETEEIIRWHYWRDQQKHVAYITTCSLL